MNFPHAQTQINLNMTFRAIIMLNAQGFIVVYVKFQLVYKTIVS